MSNKLQFNNTILDKNSNVFASKDSIYNDIFHILNGLYPDKVILIPKGTTTVTDSFKVSAAVIAHIPNSVTTISAWAFSHCSALSSVTIPDSVTTIGEYAFAYCSNLTSVTIGDSVTTIGAWAFDNCSKLTSVTIGNSVTTIGALAFNSCSKLTSVTIPDSVTSIGSWAFDKQLTNITYTGTILQWESGMTRENEWCGTGRSAANNDLPIVTCADGIIYSNGIHKILLKADQTYSIILPEARDKIHLQGKIKVVGTDYTFNNEDIKLPETISSFRLKLLAESRYEEDNKYRIYIKLTINDTVAGHISLDNNPSWNLSPLIKEQEFYIIGASFANKTE